MKKFIRANDADSRGGFPRTIKIDGSFDNIDKYIFKKVYDGFGVYEQIAPSGFFIHQEYLFTNGDITVVSPSYTNNSIYDVYDMIDSYNETGKLGQKAIKSFNKTYGKYVLILHPSGNMY